MELVFFFFLFLFWAPGWLRKTQAEPYPHDSIRVDFSCSVLSTCAPLPLTLPCRHTVHFLVGGLFHKLNCVRLIYQKSWAQEIECLFSIFYHCSSWVSIPVVHAQSLSHVRLFVISMDYSLSGCSVHEIFQPRILESVAISYTKESSLPKGQTRISCISCREICRQILYHCAAWEALKCICSAVLILP